MTAESHENSPEGGMNSPQMNSSPNNKKSIIAGIWEIIKFALISLAIVLPIRMYIAQPFIVNGASMDTTFANNQYLIVYELGYHFDQPERGDVVVFKYPLDEDKAFIKRIIGLPGETVEVSGNTVTITNSEHPDGFALDEPYISGDTLGEDVRTLGNDEYYVMGDNRDNSSDSRIWGPVHSRQLIGEALLRLFPVDKLGLYPGTYSHYEKDLSEE